MLRTLPLILATAITLAACSPAADDAAPADNESEAKNAATVSLARLDCGNIAVADLSTFSVAGKYKGARKTLTDSCYLIRHGDDVMLWDTGLPGDLAGKPASDGGGGMTMSLARSLVDQLAALAIKSDDVDIVGISHFHDDHTGQLAMFPNARLLTGKGDWDAIAAPAPDARINVVPYAHWARGGGSVTPVSGDLDIFGDGSAVMLDLPGHTPGHMGLKLVTEGGKVVMLSGDVAHFHANYDSNGVPTWNTDNDASVASIERFKQLAKDNNATVVIQHDPADIGLVPAASGTGARR